METRFDKGDFTFSGRVSLPQTPWYPGSRFPLKSAICERMLSRGYPGLVIPVLAQKAPEGGFAEAGGLTKRRDDMADYLLTEREMIVLRAALRAIEELGGDDEIKKLRERFEGAAVVILSSYEGEEVA